MTLLALAPKCVLCGLAYLGLGAALGLITPELCGAELGDSPLAWATSLAWLGAVGIVVAAGLAAGGRCKRANSQQS